MTGQERGVCVCVCAGSAEGADRSQGGAKCSNIRESRRGTGEEKLCPMVRVDFSIFITPKKQKQKKKKTDNKNSLNR